jgi:peptidoglycan/LPS O-acetylase OafA/YrhL
MEATTLKSGNTTYFENLDTTRFLGFLHVFLAHCFFTTNPTIASSPEFHLATVSIKAGFLGLDYFFVLSSFLLTWLALEEMRKTGNFNPMLFLIRRGIRLWPLYFLLLCLVYGFYQFFGDSMGLKPLPPAAVFFFFISNFYIIQHGQDFLFLLVFFWSIAVEEQFYLFWAIVLKFLQKHLLRVSFLMVVASLIFRYFYRNDSHTLSFHTLSMIGNFGMGALAAIMAFRSSAFRGLFINVSRGTSILVYLILLLLLLNYFQWFNSGFMLVFEKLIFSVFFVYLIMEQSFAKRPLIALGQFKTLSYLGQLSLGLYCYHGIVLTLMVPLMKANGLAERPLQVFLINPLLIFLLTMLLAIGSYETMEKRVHQLRRHFYPKKASSQSTRK